MLQIRCKCNIGNLLFRDKIWEGEGRKRYFSSRMVVPRHMIDFTLSLIITYLIHQLSYFIMLLNSNTFCVSENLKSSFWICTTKKFFESVWVVERKHFHEMIPKQVNLCLTIKKLVSINSRNVPHVGICKVKLFSNFICFISIIICYLMNELFKCVKIHFMDYHYLYSTLPYTYTHQNTIRIFTPHQTTQLKHYVKNVIHVLHSKI